MTTPELSILVPTYNERATLPFLLDDLGGLRVPHEVVVADGGSTDGTVAYALERGVSVVSSPRGRGTQLGAAARGARASVLCALHADVRLPAATLATIDAWVATPAATALAFSLAIDGVGLPLALIAAAANVRSRVLHLPYGDQGLLMTRAMYEGAGGYPAIPIMEDVAIVRALSRSVGITISAERVVASARRWERDNPWGRSFRNVALLTAFLCGVSPERIAGWYDSPQTGITRG